MRAEQIYFTVLTFAFVLGAAFGVCYLLGSFVETSTDIRVWSYEARSLVGIVGGILSIMVAAAIASKVFQSLKR